MIELSSNELKVSFPEVHRNATCSVNFQRTLRIPDDNQDYPLPAGLGRFPLASVDDYDTPDRWKEHGGVFLPMYQSEAMWISFNDQGYPFAVKVAAGKINAVTGDTWSNELKQDPQDYVVMPKQRWLDGFHASEDIVRQFVAMPLGEGITAEEQITGTAEWGGLQLIFYPMKASEYHQRFEYVRPATMRFSLGAPADFDVPAFCRKMGEDEMGYAPGGRIKQEIAEDPYGIDVWETSVYSRCFVHVLNSAGYAKLTGRRPPTQPLTAKEYANEGIPWFDYYLEGGRTSGSKVLAALDGVAAALHKKGKKLEDNKPIRIAGTVDLSRPKHPAVRNGESW